jgi:hypothetical protein
MGPNPFLHTQQCDEQVGLSDVVVKRQTVQ